ncbi:MAG: hypothetical protein J6Y20_08940 [Lachnospiraceae bacterium]|nr:hypothetical protein [Lachnospiraceae bacterium]
MVNIYTDTVIINEGGNFPGNVIITATGQKVALTYNDIDEAFNAGRSIILRLPNDEGCEVFPLASYWYEGDKNVYRASFGGYCGHIELIAPAADVEFEMYPQ